MLIIFIFHYVKQDFVNLISTPTPIKDKIYKWYKSQAVRYPRYYTRQLWGEDEPCLAQVSYHIIMENNKTRCRETKQIKSFVYSLQATCGTSCGKQEISQTEQPG